MTTPRRGIAALDAVQWRPATPPRRVLPVVVCAHCGTEAPIGLHATTGPQLIDDVLAWQRDHLCGAR